MPVHATRPSETPNEVGLLVRLHDTRDYELIVGAVFIRGQV